MKRIVYPCRNHPLCFFRGPTAGQREDQLYNAVLGATFTDEKSSGGTARAARHPGCKAKLLKLLEDKSSWNREAAARGLALIGSADASRALFDRMLTDRMINDAIRNAFVAKHRPALRLSYRLFRERGQKIPRRSLESSVRRGHRGEAFLKGIIEDRNSEDRSLPSSTWCGFPANNYRYKSYRDTVPLRFHALAYLADNGTLKTSPSSSPSSRRKEEPKNMLVAYKGQPAGGRSAPAPRLPGGARLRRRQPRPGGDVHIHRRAVGRSHGFTHPRGEKKRHPVDAHDCPVAAQGVHLAGRHPSARHGPGRALHPPRAGR